MKTKIFVSTMLLLTSFVSFSQTFHSNIQIDAVNNLNYSHGVNRESVTFIIDLVKSKFSITSSFMTFQNYDLILWDARVANDDKGQRYSKSKYEVLNNGSPFGLYLYIEDFKNVKSEMIVGSYNKSFTLELQKEGKQTLLLGCIIKELDLPIKYDPKTIWCHYYNSYTSNYRLEGVDNIETKRTKVVIDIDTVNNYFSLNSYKSWRLTFIEKGETEYLGNLWRYSKNQFGESANDFLTIYDTDVPVTVDNIRCKKIFSITTIDPSTKKKTFENVYYVDTSPTTDEEKNIPIEYIEGQ